MDSDSYRYGFNGMEKDDEIKGSNSSYDFGARMYDNRIGRWFATDPQEKRGSSISTYSYNFNNPIIFSDPTGEWPKLKITTEITGYTIQRVYGTDNIFSTPAIVVPTYKAIIYDVQEDGTEKVIKTFNVTRDGWYFLGDGENDTVNLLNRTFEPAVPSQDLYNLVGVAEYPDGSNAQAYKLTRTKNRETGEQTNRIPAIPLATNKNDEGELIKDHRANNDFATGVMLHIGSTYDVKGTQWLGGSFGCFSFIPPDDIYKTVEKATQASADDDYDDKTANVDWAKITKLINNLQAEDNYEKFQIVVKARNNVETKKTVDEKEIIKE